MRTEYTYTVQATVNLSVIAEQEPDRAKLRYAVQRQIDRGDWNVLRDADVYVLLPDTFPDPTAEKADWLPDA